MCSVAEFPTEIEKQEKKNAHNYLIFVMEKQQHKKYWLSTGQDRTHRTSEHNLAEIFGIFGLKTPLHACVLGEHTSMKNELCQTNVKSKGFIYRTSYLRCFINAYKTA